MTVTVRQLRHVAYRLDKRREKGYVIYRLSCDGVIVYFILDEVGILGLDLMSTPPWLPTSYQSFQVAVLV